MDVHTHHTEKIQAALFGGFLLGFVIASFALMFGSVDSLVLGTELNPNGTVEYLCLGRACEGLTAMDW